MMFAVMFGPATDYEVFLVSRTGEHAWWSPRRGGAVAERVAA